MAAAKKRGAPRRGTPSATEKILKRVDRRAKKSVARFVLLVKPFSKVTVKRDLPWWPMTNGVCDAVTVRIEVDDEGDVIVDGFSAGIDKTQAVEKKYLNSAEGAWCAMQELNRRNWHFVHVPLLVE